MASIGSKGERTRAGRRPDGPAALARPRGWIRAALGVLALAGLAGSPMVGSAPTEVPAPRQGASLTVTLDRGEAVSIQAWKSGGTWTLSVTDPSGVEKTSFTWDDPVVTMVTWSAEGTGEFGVACRPRAAPGAVCELESVAAGPRTGDVAEWTRVEAAIREGHVLLRKWTPDARRRALAVLSGAVERSRALGSAPLQVDALVGLARARREAGDLPGTTSVLEEAVSTAARISDSRRLALASARLGSALALEGDLEEAERRLDVAQAQAAVSRFALGAAEAHLARGDVLYFRGALAEAGDEFRLARETFEEAGNAAGTIEASLNEGYAVADLGLDDRARDIFEGALVLARRSEERRFEALALRVLGNVCSKLSESYQAIRYFQAAQRLFEESEDRVALVGLYNGLGEVHARLHDLEVAIRYHEKAEELARAIPRPASRGSALIEIAQCQLLLGRPEAATRSYEKASEVFRALGDRAMLAATVDGLGGALAAAGRLEEAIDHFEQALALMQTVGETRQSSRVLSHLAETHLKRGDTGRARQAAQDAVRLAKEAGDLDKEAQALFILARVDRDEGALEDAKLHAEQALGVDETVRSRVPSRQLRALFFTGVEPRYGFYVDLLMEMEALRPEAPYERLAFEASERARARVLLDRLQVGLSDQQFTEEFAERGRALREEIRREALVADLEAGRDDAEARDQLRERLAELRRIEGLSELLPVESISPDPVAPPSPNETQTGVIDEKTLLLEYLLGQERSYLWVIGLNRFSVHVLPSRTRLETDVREVYEAVTARQRVSGGSARQRRLHAERQDALFVEKGRALAATLLGPIRGLDDYGRLVVVADGLLHYLPFSILPHPLPASSEDGYQPLLLSHEVVRMPSLSAAVALRRRSSEATHAGRLRHKGVAVLADPVFAPEDPRVHGKPRGETPLSAVRFPALEASLESLGKGLETLPRLLSSRQEASSIARTGGTVGVSVLTDFEASRESAERVLRAPYRVVHFATHGVLNDEQPELSGLVLTLVNAGGDLQDGFLRAQDVYGLPVGANLVVLSGCETALGTMLRGEGITGLVRAFIHSGADTVVASTWRVDDWATEELMSAFYRGLLVEGRGPADALRQAQIELFRRRSTSPPFFWGAFEVYGLSRRATTD